MMELKKFVVKKSQWLRGESSSKSYLLRQLDNKMCCLGFASLACKIDQSDISGIRIPTSVASHSKYPKSFFANFDEDEFEESNCIGEIMEINDDPSLGDEERMSQLTKKFSKIGIEIVFED